MGANHTQSVALLVAGSLGASLAAFAGCGGGASGSGGGSTTSGTFDGGGKIVLECTVPAPPSMGSCVVVPVSDAGELDAGLDDAGNASITTCNPVTNAGCTGADVCALDDMNAY